MLVFIPVHAFNEHGEADVTERWPWHDSRFQPRGSGPLAGVGEGCDVHPSVHHCEVGMVLFQSNRCSIRPVKEWTKRMSLAFSSSQIAAMSCMNEIDAEKLASV